MITKGDDKPNRNGDKSNKKMGKSNCNDKSKSFRRKDSYIFGPTWGHELEAFGSEVRDKARAFGMDPEEF